MSFHWLEYGLASVLFVGIDCVKKYKTLTCFGQRLIVNVVTADELSCILSAERRDCPFHRHFPLISSLGFQPPVLPILHDGTCDSTFER